MCPPADSGGFWGAASGTDDTWNDTPANNMNSSNATKQFGGDDFGSRGFGDENNPNFDSDQPKRGCFNCGEDDHNKADCPHPTKFTGTCKNCDEEGHMAKDCPTRGPMACNYCKEEGHMIKDCPTRPPMACNYCKEEGHMAKDCPTRGPMTCNHCKEEGHMVKDCPMRPPQVCTNCNQEGHSRAKCENARAIDRSHVADGTPDEAWDELQAAIKARDLDDVKTAIEKYSKECPEMTYLQIQEGLYDIGLDLYLIATERPLLPTYTNMDLQGNLNKKYTISYRFSDQPERPREKDGWPSTKEEILSRLNDAGMPVEGSAPLCSNCNELGHVRKHCKQEPTEVSDRPTIMCYNCNETGHRVRDCPQPRSTRGACRNCGKPGHKASDCEEPRSAANVDCRKCGEVGHFSRDCPQGGGKRACHTCGSEDHLARECPDKANKDNDFYTKHSKDDDFGAHEGGDGNPTEDAGWNTAPAINDGDALWDQAGNSGGW
ncbi:related to hexamer-binding protein HEXBP [Cephalotrichum gorgonifer]|uniref:Related to hexamer-binding protein HEXBP n=1 Tax=Cephalotrichum gorgonifer TaxID=2041049 RepID=A0AAE8MSA4_9PEZI|nr:related to hexamer-binding protein HEXBP [Cephalotrichum gorgonifer]